VLLAGLLYLGSGVGLGSVLAVRRMLRRNAATRSEAPLARGDLLPLAGAVLTGGVAAPVALLWGLAGMHAADAALLLNFESILTTFIAAAIFREAVGGRVWLAAGVMLAAGTLLAYDAQAPLRFSPHALAVVGACALWGLDNNLTRAVSAADPLQIAAIKGAAAGSVNFTLGFTLGGATPGVDVAGAALAIGFASYGLSLVLFIYALRHLGAARTGAHFGTAPFIGAAVAVPLLGEPVTAALAAAAALMALATWLVLTETHAHVHTHEYLEHTHQHVHDEHHRHDHRGGEGPEPHAHAHVHLPITHAHPHLPDLHHRHDH
jgi:drug/metabolite transporter (DMT)-like permease